jgi:hypothetical protein
VKNNPMLVAFKAGVTAMKFSLMPSRLFYKRPEPSAAKRQQ